MNSIISFANRLSEYSAFYVVEAGAVANVLDLLVQRQYYTALGAFSIGISIDAFRRFIKKYDTKTPEDKNLEERL